jgi:hypothetical protein
MPNGVAATAATSMAAPSRSIPLMARPPRRGRPRRRRSRLVPWHLEERKGQLPSDPRPRRRTAFESRNALLDEVNRRLLAALEADPRVTMSALARQVGMSAPPVTERCSGWSAPG